MMTTTPANEVLNLFAARIEHAANVDGATAAPLLNEEARNLAGALVDLVEDLADTIAHHLLGAGT